MTRQVKEDVDTLILDHTGIPDNTSGQMMQIEIVLGHYDNPNISHRWFNVE